MPESLDPDVPPLGWEALPAKTRFALEYAWDSGVPGIASAVHARWWQLETWLRSLVYVELRAAYGESWLEVIGKTTIKRAKTELKFAHMSSTDANLVLSHLDVSALFELIQENWQIFEPSLIDQEIWNGRVRELKQVRHRIAHCRRPHRDDISRIEQTLRDLERGAYRAIVSYNSYHDPERKLVDPIVAYWIRGGHPEAELITHAEISYGITFRLAYTQRPWADAVKDGGKIAGEPGYLWHAAFYMAGRRVVTPQRLWQDSYLDLTDARNRLVFLSCEDPSHVNFAFPAVDSPESIANDIACCLHAVLSASQPLRSEDDYENYEARLRQDIDPRVQAATPRAYVDNAIWPISLFSATSTT